MAPSIPALDPASRQFQRFRTSGDPKALGAVFDASAPDLMALASHFTTDLAAAEDLVQECFLIAMKKARSWDARRPVVPWLAGILIAEARKMRRRRWRRVDPERLGERTAPEGLHTALSGEVRDAVERAVEELPARYRDVVHASLLGGEEPQAIARRLHRAPGTVRVQLHRGLDLLRRALPVGIGLGALSALSSRGLDEVRRHLITEASILGPSLAAAGTASLTFTNVGALVMGAKGLAVATLAIVALGAGLSQLGGSGSEVPASMNEVLPAATELASTESLVALAEPTERQELGPAVDVAAAAEPIALEAEESPFQGGKVWLTGEIIAAQPPPSLSFELEISAGANLDRKQVEVLPGPGPFRLDITHLVGGDDPERLRLLSIARCEGYIPSSAWCGLADGGSRDSGNADEVVYEAKLTPRAILRTITGRLVTPDGQAVGARAQRPWVAFLPESLEEPLEYQHLPWASVDSDGTFELRLTDERSGAVLYTANGFAVGRCETASGFAGGETLFECGDLILPNGATIDGRALEAGSPVEPGSVVIATVSYRGTPWDMLRRQLRLHDGRGLHAGTEAVVSQGGRFVLEGLEPGVSYGLCIVPKTSGVSTWPAVEEGAGESVTAPASGIELQSDLRRVTVRVLADGEPVRGVRIRSRANEAGDARGAVPHTLLGGLGSGFEAHGSSEMKLWIASDRVTELFVSAKGYEDQRLDLDPDESGPDGVVTVELARSAATAQVRVKLEGPSPASMENWKAMLVTYDRSMRAEFIGPVSIQGAAAVFDEVPIGLLNVRLALQLPSTLRLAELPLCQSAGFQLHLPDLVQGEVREVVARLPLQGRIELHLVGRDDAVAPVFELVEESGNVVRPPLIVASDSGHRQSFAVEDDGPMLLGSTLPPGTYVLRQAAPGYTASEREVEVVAGEVTLVSFQLDAER